MSEIKKLAGQTAYYGISSILGRLLNFLLLPLWTSQFPPDEYGAVTHLYSFVALLNIVYTYGLETGYFRFSTKNKSTDAYHQTGTSILITSTLFSGLIILMANNIANFLQEGIKAEYVVYLAIILFIDGIVSIPFAKLRLDQRPVKFVIVRSAVIIATIVLNLLFLVVFPAISEGRWLPGLEGIVSRVYDPEIGIGYIFLANMIANILYLPLLVKEFMAMKLKFDLKALKPILAYSIPIFLMGLAGSINDRGYGIVMPFLYPETDGLSGTGALGTFDGAFKLSMIMALGVQAFRYAGEPFFFSHAENKAAPALFARIMHYFVIFSLVVMVGVAMNIELIADIFLQRPAYKTALYVLPILLLAKLLYGVYINFSVWFKIKDKTLFGTYFAWIGATITLVGNFILIPIIEFWGPALTAFIVYLTMCILCYSKGRKYFKVPYNFKPLFSYLVLALLFIYGGNQLHFDNNWLEYGISFAGSGVFVFIMYWLEGRNVKYKAIS